ncbi:uncharacterized protein LOC131308461 isoform X2 [Rhododendron vialii]|uniref:uncharacterized protein LOC131308461 isoform X2 n=1 Tax=Rhododendron vialii TaxID=182163 RepID=UPI00265ECF5E|nr:uncharacterized protein LOC131308461 isoform X2 [Rhododendron vialii]
MQRQSLGSPNSKLHSTNGGTLMGAKEINLVTGDDQRRKDQPSSPAAADGDNDKSQKPHKSPPPKPEKFVHVIPILTVVCFLILYLSSHDPSQKDSTEAEDSGGFLDVEKSDVLAIRSLRNLQEVGKHGPKSRLHRKIGDF